MLQGEIAGSSPAERQMKHEWRNLVAALGRIRTALPPGTRVGQAIESAMPSMDHLLQIVDALPSSGAEGGSLKERPALPPPRVSPPSTPQIQVKTRGTESAPSTQTGAATGAATQALYSRPVKGRPKAPPPPKGKKPPPRSLLSAAADPNGAIVLERKPEPHLIPRPIQWQGFSADKVTGSIWEGLLEADKEQPSAQEWVLKNPPQSGRSPNSVPPKFRFQVQYPVLDALFFQDANAKIPRVPRPSSESVAASTTVSCLDSKRAQRIEISLKGCKLYDDFTPIYEAICNFKFNEVAQQPEDKRLLGPDVLQFLMEVYPTPDEIRALKALAGSLLIGQRIAPADRLLLELVKINRFPQRADAVHTKMTFGAELHAASEKISKLSGFCTVVLEALSETGILRPVLALILKMGNYVNANSKKPLVSGIQISSLESLRQIRSIDGTKCFTRVLAEHIDDQMPGTWGSLQWMCHCADAQELNPDDLLTTLKYLESRINKIDLELKTAEAQKEDRFVICFKGFVAQSYKGLQKLNIELEETKGQLLSLREMFVERAKTPKECLEIFRKLGKFGKDLYSCKTEIEAEKRLQEKRRFRESRMSPSPARRQAPRRVASSPGTAAYATPASRLVGTSEAFGSLEASTPSRSPPKYPPRIPRYPPFPQQQPSVAGGRGPPQNSNGGGPLRLDQSTGGASLWDQIVS